MHHINLNAEQDLCPQLATYLLNTNTDLSNVLCVLPNDFLITPLQQQLKNQKAQFLPRISTLQELSSSCNKAVTILASHQCKLLLAQLLKKHRHLYGKGSYWGLANNLLQLFDELSLQCISVETSWDEFKDSISKNTISQNHSWFNREAQLVYILWQAWHQQMQDEGWLDPASAYASSLQELSRRPHSFDQLVFIQPNKLRQCEANWLQEIPVATTVIGYSTTILQEGKLSCAPCQSAEEQALAICLAAKQAAQAQQSTIIVGEDRRLTRRIHALLARFNIRIDDKSGWTLSTTQIGACLEHWLQCIENNFSHQSLLDFLKSPFVLPLLDGKMKAVFHLEKDLVHHENISSGLSAFKLALHSRQQRLGNTSSESYQVLLAIFDTLECAARPLIKLQKNRQPHQPQLFLNAFKDSLQVLAVDRYLQEDSAGQQLLRLLDEFETGNEVNADNLNWEDFRHWLNQAMEGSYFRPSVQQAQVTLLTYAQAHFVDAEMRILCSADTGHLPPPPPSSPFFNQQARTSLGLETGEQFNQRHLKTFERLHSAKGSVLITWQAEQEGEPMEASGWVRLLQQQHDIPIAQELLELARTASQEQHYIKDYTDAKVSANNLCKEHYSAGSHQRLISCPYHYFASDLLALKPIDEIREALEKSDYGSRVHLCLEAFHHNISHLPGPFSNTLSPANSHSALKLLEEISQAVFLRDTLNNFQHRSWLKRWLAITPYYIKWQTQRQQDWQAQQFEQSIDHPVNPQFSIKGRIDRIDTQRERKSTSILDYKTGFTPSPKDMLSGEDVQLSTYAFTLEHVEQCAYINLQDPKPIHERNSLCGEDLAQIIQASQQRLEQLHSEIHNGRELPAWGKQAVCDRCNNAGICRRQVWAS